MSELGKLNTRAPLDRSPKKNWVENAGGLPMYVRRIANHLHAEKGMTISRAIAVAVNAVKKMCATGDLNFKGKQSVNAGSRAEACAAVADWERKKAGARISKGVVGRKWTDTEFINYLVWEEEIHKGCGCSRDKRKKKKMKMQRPIEKANPLWDGDGVQSPGQKRGKGGRWSGGAASGARAALNIASRETTVKLRDMGAKKKLTKADYDFANKVQTQPRSSPQAFNNAKYAQGLMARYMKQSKPIRANADERAARREFDEWAPGRNPAMGQGNAAFPGGKMPKNRDTRFDLVVNPASRDTTAKIKELTAKKKLTKADYDFANKVQLQPRSSPNAYNNAKRAQAIMVRYHKQQKKSGVSKARGSNPFWDGDGLNGVGQPRDHKGQWVRLPGAYKAAKIGVWEHDDGSFGVYEGSTPNAKPRTPVRTHKTYRAAAKDAANKVVKDRPDTGGMVEHGYRQAQHALNRGEGFKGAKKEVRAGARAASRTRNKYESEQNQGVKLNGGFKVGQKATIDPTKVQNKAFHNKKVTIVGNQGENLIIQLPNGDRKLVKPSMLLISKSLITEQEIEKLDAEINAEFNADTDGKVSFEAISKIEEIDEEKRLVFGWCSIAKHKDGTVEVDKQGDVLEDIDQMENVAYDFVLNSRDGGEMHVRKGVSTLVESFVSTKEKWDAMGIPDGVLPVGWWVGFKVHDTEVWKGVKSGKYRMFSVHGSGTRKALD
jgi:hypothetical protein